MVFPAVIYRCESWTIKKAEHWRTDVFKLCCCRKLLEVLGLQGDQTGLSWRKSTLNFHWKDWCWVEAPVLWLPDWKSWLIPWCWERLKAGGKGDNRGWDGWMASVTQWTWVWANSGRCRRTGKAWCAAVHGIAKSQTWLRDRVTATAPSESPAAFPLLFLPDSRNGTTLLPQMFPLQIFLKTNWKTVDDHLYTHTDTHFSFSFC